MECTQETQVLSVNPIQSQLHAIEQQAGFHPNDPEILDCIQWTDRINSLLVSGETIIPQKISRITMCEFPSATIPHRWFEVIVRADTEEPAYRLYIWDGSHQFIYEMTCIPKEQGAVLWNGYTKAETRIQIYPEPLPE